MLRLIKDRSQSPGKPHGPGPGPDDPGPVVAQPCPQEQELVAALAAGDEAAFARLVDQYHRPLVRQAMAFVPCEAVAEEVVQETWLAVMESVHRFEGRSSLKTWLYQILIYKAKSAGVKESRQVPFSAVTRGEEQSDESEVEYTLADGIDAHGPARYCMGASDEDPTPEDALVAEECRREIQQAIRSLPNAQRQVLELYHFKEASSEEVCRKLRITETNKHVLLHRGRRKVKKAVDRYFAGDRRRSNTVRQVYQLGLAA